MYVVPSAFQSVYELTAGTYRRVTHIVVYVFKSRVYNFLALVSHDFQLVAVISEYFFEKPHVHRENIRAENGVFSFHLLRKIYHLTYL